MNLIKYVKESLNSTINERGTIGTVEELNNHPKTKEELRDLIKTVFKRYGRSADLNFIDTSEITDMSELFRDLRPINIKIDKWDTSNVTNMSNMFTDSQDFDADISEWDVSKVTNMQFMFHSCSNFTCDISGWDVSKVTNMDSIFENCYRYNVDLSGWDVRKVKTHFDAFEGCEKMTRRMLPQFYTITQ